MSSGTTFFFESASYVGATCELTKLKKYRCPIHITPATTWIQRNSDCRTSMTPLHPTRPHPLCGENGAVRRHPAIRVQHEASRRGVIPCQGSLGVRSLLSP